MAEKHFDIDFYGLTFCVEFLLEKSVPLLGER